MLCETTGENGWTFLFDPCSISISSANYVLHLPKDIKVAIKICELFSIFNRKLKHYITALIPIFRQVAKPLQGARGLSALWWRYSYKNKNVNEKLSTMIKK